MKNQTTKQKFHALVKTMAPLVKTKDGKVKGGVLVVKSERQLEGALDINWWNCGNCGNCGNCAQSPTTRRGI